jgi:hypothetical protein
MTAVMPRAPGPLDTLLVTLGVALAVVLIGLASSGCGASALSVQADLVALGGIAVAEADEALTTARAAELDRIVDQAEHDCADRDCDLPGYQASYQAVVERWDPILACRLAPVEALRSWTAGLETAALASDSVAERLLLTLGGRFLVSYDALRVCLEPVSLPLPALPPLLLEVLR